MQMAAPEALDIAQGIGGDAQALRPGQARVRHVRPAVPDRPAAGRARRAVRADLRRQRSRRATAA